jgi:DNA-binding NarL/FixJ family response regulator
VESPVSSAGSGSQVGKPIAVFLLDDHEVVRRGVGDLLEAEPDITVVGEADTASSALARIPALRPDVAILDVRLPDGDGVSVCREIRSQMPEVACLMLTSFDDDEALFDAIMAGAAGYVLKQIRGTDLVGAVRTVASGRSMLDPRAARQLMARLRDQSAHRDPLAGLTAQERRILELIGEGLTNRQIGERMFLAEKTVKNYVSTLFAKLGMERRTQAAAYAVRVFSEQREHESAGRHPGPGELRLSDAAVNVRRRLPKRSAPAAGCHRAADRGCSAMGSLPLERLARSTAVIRSSRPWRPQHGTVRPQGRDQRPRSS